MESLGLERCRGLESETAYLKHLLDALRLDRTILVDIATEDNVCISIFVALFVLLVVAQFSEHSLRHVGVQVVDVNSFGHFS